MAKLNGHWYTDKNGNHYFVENGQTPQEGWKASKRRKMIDNGKFKVSEDGKEYRDVDSEEYNKFEADENDFDNDLFEDDDETELNIIDDKVLNKENTGRWKELDEKLPEMREALINKVGLTSDSKNLSKSDMDIHNEYVKVLKEDFGLSDKEAKAVIAKEIGFANDSLQGIAESEDDAGSPYKESDRKWMKDHIEDNPNISDESLMEDIIERFSELSPDDEQYVKELLKNRQKEPDESKKVKMGIDSQNRAYVQSSDGNRQYFASEKEAKDYANRMNEAQGLSKEEKEPNPMDEFSGPDREGPSYAQLEALDDKEISDLREKIDSDFYSKGGLNEQIIDYINKHHKLDDEELSKKLQEHFDDYGALNSYLQNKKVGFLGNTMPKEETEKIINKASSVLNKYKTKSKSSNKPKEKFHGGYVTDNGDGTYTYNGVNYPGLKELVEVFGNDVKKYIKDKK